VNTVAAARVAYTAGAAPPFTTGRWAVLAGVAGLLANLLLVLFFALGLRPGSGFAWLGPANDVVIVVQFLALVAVATAIRDRFGGEIAAAVGIVAMLSVVALQLMLLAGVLEFEVQGPLVVGCQTVVFGWLLVISWPGRMPMRVARFGRRVAMGYVLGTFFAGFSLLLPWGTPAQFVGFVVAGIFGLPAWLGFPVWSLRVAQLFKEGS
jgi:hypothetical protein